MILIDALFVNHGGGGVLLQYLIEKILAHPQKDNFFFLLDPRFKKPAALEKNYTVIPNNIRERIKFYKKEKNNFTKVFCFANTPPPVKLSVPTYTYLHNQKLLEAPGMKFKKHFFSQYIKYLFLKLYNRNTDYYIVQTQHMVDGIVKVNLKKTGKCLILPFYDNKKYIGNNIRFDQRRKNEFVFISNPTPQKNYPTLLDAWGYLLENDVTPILHVTIDNTAPLLLARVGDLNNKGAKIINHNYINPIELYFNCPYLIFPSVMESFGLPLVEAVDSGMKVLASNLPFVHDVVQPSATFKPYDKVSIANTVIKAMKEELPPSKIVTANKIDELIALLAK
jgi:glycosyltransferase involved in cell wall biosynthesis